MRLELEDFSTLNQIQQIKEEIKEQKIDEAAKIEQLRDFYEKKIQQIENHYKELLAKVSKESYEQGFSDAKNEYEQKLKEAIEETIVQKEAEKEQALAEVKSTMLNIEESLKSNYKEYLGKFTDIIVDSISEILEFLYIDKSNVKIVKEAIDKLLEDFNNFLPLSIQVPPSLYEEIKKKFNSVEVKRNKELSSNEFVIEFHDFKIENRIKEKLSVIKDEIKRETKKLT